MNVGYYVVAFDKATDTLCQQFGCGWEYTRDKIGMTFVLEAHVTYDREVKEGDALRITTQILDHDAKRIHYIHAMYHANEGYLAATNELMLMNIDYADAAARPPGPTSPWSASRSSRRPTPPCPARPRPAASSASRRSNRVHASVPAVRTARTHHARAARHPPLHRAAGMGRLERPHERGLLRHRLRPGLRRLHAQHGAGTPLRRRQARHDLRAGDPRHLRSRDAARARRCASPRSCSSATPRRSISSTRCTMPSRTTWRRPTRRS